MKRSSLLLASLLVISCALPSTVSFAGSARETLSREALNVSAWALSGLEETVPPDIRRNLSFLREDLLDEGKSAPQTNAASYKLGSDLCNALIAALDEHDQTAVRAGFRAAQANANTTSRAEWRDPDTRVARNYLMRWTQYAHDQSIRGEVQNRHNNEIVLAKQQVRVEWSNRCAVLRSNLDELYKHYREALRQDSTFKTGEVPTQTKIAEMPSMPPATTKPNPESTPAAADSTKDVTAMPPELQALDVIAQLRQLNPGLKDENHTTTQDGKITELCIWVEAKGPKRKRKSLDITPIRALVDLKKLRLGKEGHSPMLEDLSPLTGMQLSSLSFGHADRLTNLRPLQGMPLTSLNCAFSSVEDLSPLQGMSLAWLSIRKTKVHDLSPLQGMPLKYLNCSGTKIADLTPLKGMQLSHICCGQTQVTDLSPLQGMPLKAIGCDFKPERDSEILRSFKGLNRINGLPADVFWKLVAQGKTPQKEMSDEDDNL